jgi:hypothetical protein
MVRIKTFAGVRPVSVVFSIARCTDEIVLIEQRFVAFEDLSHVIPFVTVFKVPQIQTE